jgi:hypothetical protein
MTFSSSFASKTLCRMCVLKQEAVMGAIAAEVGFVRTLTFQPAKMLKNARKSGSTGRTAAS